MTAAQDGDGGPEPGGDPGLLHRIEAIAAAAETAPAAPPDAAWIDALVARLEAGFEARLGSEVAALREDLADALDDLTVDLQRQLAAIRDAIAGKSAGESG
jgi:hypothetical protein